MAQDGSLTYLLDESMGRPIANVLRLIRAPGAPHIHDARDAGFAGMKDEALMRRARAQAYDVIVWADSRVLNASIRRNAWRETGLKMFVLGARWADLKLFEQARHLIWWWPAIVAQAESSPAGSAWHVPVEFRPDAIVRMFPDLG